MAAAAALFDDEDADEWAVGGVKQDKPVGAAINAFTSSEIANVAELRRAVSDLADHPIAGPYLKDDGVMWRYFTAKSTERTKDAQLQEAETMFRESTQWKVDVDVAGTMLLWEASDTFSLASKTEEARLGDRHFYGGICGLATSGGPFMVERLGKVDIGGLSHDEACLAAVKKSYIHYIESAWRMVRAKGGKTQAVMVIDMQGLGMSILRHLSTLKEMSKIASGNYPEITRTIFLVNPPWGFQTIWKAVSSILPPKTRDKITMLSDDVVDVLSKHIEGGKSNLPDFLGGDNCSHNICSALPVGEEKEGEDEDGEGGDGGAAEK
mmetsp:Transcript_17376/g.51399  ORF Transcript_17376/g.51399 Transcript_17376/m.51399 type:complete len:323 (-) Transcript_17376:158-1126(-)